MIEEILMGLGAALYVAGEIYADRKTGDTTTSYVRRFLRASKVGWAARLGIVGFFTWVILDLNGWL